MHNQGQQKIVPFNKVMVANRGEIAIRVLRAASELQLRTVAIYTYEDRYSLHRYKADEAYQIGENDNPLQPYLDIEAIIRLAKTHDVDAIHPGYGFLSENEQLVRRCKEEGITFIGPDAEVIAQLGDKVAAKELAKRANVPIIEDSQQTLNSVEIALAEAQRIGYPIMVKAAAGGGGRGMRVVRSEADLAKSFEEAKNEALSAFGDGTVFLEKYIESPKHIEVQILGDNYGNIVHLFERDCSVQRRFQKVVEIAPSLTLPAATQSKIYDYAIQLAEEVNYNCAGTVEFLVDATQNVYFIEVNPRIQVEHTITEEITGVDLVRSQILTAMGHPLNGDLINIKNQKAIKANGFAIQCRVTTENPSNDFKPDYGTLIAYRSASGMGIRLDAGSAFAGANISPYFDSMLVKVTAWGQTLDGAADRLHRALREFRVRGVSTNIGFLLNLLKNPTFRNGEATVSFIDQNPDLLKPQNWKDRGTKLLRYLAEINVNGNADIKKPDTKKVFQNPIVPAFDKTADFPFGSRNRLQKMGREAFVDWLKKENQIQYTDTTFRDAHQSLLATRMRSFDMLKVTEGFAKKHAEDVFSMEVWGGATFDVSLRFLKEDPWKRLQDLRKSVPNILFQMLLRGSNGVGYKAYPDNLIEQFIETSAAKGIDLFRIFDSLNWVENMKTSIRAVRENTNSLAEACICYTGDITNPTKQKFNLNYYVELAQKLEDAGAHIICIKDMAGLLKPLAATQLITALKEKVNTPIHLHTHDTSSIQSATYLSAINAGVDVIDVAASSLSGLTSQPSFNSVAAMMQSHPRENVVNLPSLNQYSNYWETVRTMYYPFETELKSGTASVYDHEIPGGQYSNLKPQARGLGLEDQFETIKTNYKIANELFGELIKVTPSSKVVGDMAMFMTSNGLSKEDVLNNGKTLAFPDSVVSLMRGDLGQIEGGFPKTIQAIVLKGEKPYTNRPNEHLNPLDFEKEKENFNNEFGENLPFTDLLSYLLYPKVYSDFHEFQSQYGRVSNLPTPAFFYGLKPNEEIMVELSPGKNLLIKYLNITAPDDEGNRVVLFSLNGQARSIQVKDRNLNIETITHRKAESANEVGAPLQGNLSKILVKEGDWVEENTALFAIEAMKMESTITAPRAGEVIKIHLSAKTLVQQGDLVIELA